MIPKIELILVRAYLLNCRSPRGTRSSISCDVIPGHLSHRGQRCFEKPECVVFGCRNIPNPKEGIALHPIPILWQRHPTEKKKTKEVG